MRRLISLVSAFVAFAALGLVLYNATTQDRRPPEVRSVKLSATANDDRVAQTLTAIDIEFTEPVDRASAESRFTIEPAVEGAFSWHGSTAIFTPSHELPADAAFTITIRPGFADLVGNASVVGLDGWAFRTVGAPVVLRTTPADGAIGVPLDGTLELVFDRLMDTVSVESALRVEPSAQVGVTWSGSVVTFDFGKGLRFGTTYTITLAGSAADTGGSELGTSFVTHFTTVAAGLGITSVVPANGIAGIGQATPIAISFDAPIDPATAATAVHITPSVDGSVRVEHLAVDSGSAAATPAPDAPGDTIVFEPSQALAPNTTYTVTLDPTVARLDDATAVTAGRTWSFTTGSPTTSGQNQIAFMSARSGVRNVWVMNPDGTNQRQLTVQLVPVSSFDATADGREVVYAAGGLVTVTSIDGRDVRQLTVDNGSHEYAPTFTPDDEGVLLARRDTAGADAGYWLVPLAAAGTERQLLTAGAPARGSSDLGGDGIAPIDGTPAWMPRVAFDGTGRVVLIIGADGTANVVALGAGDANVHAVQLRADAAPIWSPERDAFVVAATDLAGANRGLHTVAADGGSALIAGTAGAVGPVALGPDGSIAVLRLDSGGAHAMVVVGPGDAVRSLPSMVGRDDRWPAFTPDGSTLLVGRTLTAQPEQSDGIWLIDLGGGPARQLAADGAYAHWIP